MKILKIVSTTLFISLLVPVQGICGDTLDGAEIKNLLAGRTIVNATQARKDDYQKLISADGRWTGIKANGELAGAGFWRISQNGQFCQRNQTNKWAEQCVTIKKEGDHYASFIDTTENGKIVNSSKVSVWKVVDDTPAIAQYKEQIAEEYNALAAAYEKQTGNSYQEVLAARRQDMSEGQDAMIAEYKKRALEALPAAGKK